VYVVYIHLNELQCNTYLRNLANKIPSINLWVKFWNDAFSEEIFIRWDGTGEIVSDVEEGSV
jgi:hypothetical protein